MSRDECIHLLERTQCGFCSGLIAQERADEEAERARVLALPGWFPAKYPGKCRSCPNTFVEGDPISRSITPHGYIGMCCAPAGDPA